MVSSTIVLLGATGNLATTRIIPALYHLLAHKKIDKLLVVGAAYEKVEAADLLERCKRYIPDCDEALWQKLKEAFYYCPVNFGNPHDFQELAQQIDSLEKKHAMDGNRLVYLSIAPKFFCPVTQELHRYGIIQKQEPNAEPWTRVVYEKPFGENKDSAHALNMCIAKCLDESQIFRIDHYLAKDIVGNLALLRFTNRVLEPLWNKDNIAWVEIDLSEDMGMEGRGAYYDGYGALKDMVQNHMLQIVALIAMEAPVYLSGEFIRDEKAKVLKRTKLDDVLLGQYEGYTKEAGVNPDSTTETFTALKLSIDTPRWQGVPFYLKNGKALTKKETVIRIQFKPVKCLLNKSCPSEPNYLEIRVMPDPGFSLVLNVKKPGMATEVTPIGMDFSYEGRFGKTARNTYEVLLNEVLKGEPSVSVRFDEIEHAWDVIDAVQKFKTELATYRSGSKGPDELAAFAEKHGMKWRS